MVNWSIYGKIINPCRRLIMPQVKIDLSNEEFKALQDTAKYQGSSIDDLASKLIKKSISRKRLPKPLSKGNPLLKYVGCIKDGPRDLSKNLDKYLYGNPL
jgi:hypothetical protein